MFIVQVGAGGTGNWYARALAHSLMESYKDNPIDIDWTLVDPDVVEARNLIRQPFYGGINVNKADYLASLIRNLFKQVQYPEGKSIVYRRELLINEIEDLEKQISLPTEILILVSCVDNTYTRQVMEKFLARHKGSLEKAIYVNMGVTEEGAWISEVAGLNKFLPTTYKDDEITLPDELMSCAEREERGPVPQTTYSNIMAGTTAAQLTMEALRSEHINNYLKVVSGGNLKAVVHPEWHYYTDRMT